MCGLAGICRFDGELVEEGLLERMTRAIAHRGPDGAGHYHAGSVGLGHRRLAVLDLSDAARQPMVNDAQDLVIAYNGEVYNFRELRAELETKGYRFRSRSDTEVVLKAYEEWGEKCVDRFNGMFAFAVYDVRRQELILARDRYGMKPLYYMGYGRTFLFASEIKAILAHPKVRANMDLEALLEYFTFQNFFTDRTLFAGVRLLPAGCLMRVSVRTGKIGDAQRYWDYEFVEPEHPAASEEYLEEFDRLFRQAVQRQLVSDVDVGVYLSGGMDSGSITAIAAAQRPYLKSFTCRFDLHSASGLELAFDEGEKAELMSYLYKTEHYEMVLKAGDMERVLPRLAWHLEEPRVGQSYPNFYMAQLASKFVKVVLSGGGGDELFGGYPWRYYRAVVNDDFEHYVDKYYQYWQRLLPGAVIETAFAPVWGRVKHVATRDIFRDVFAKHAPSLTRPEDYINHSLYFEAKTFLHGLLMVEDKLSMANGLEARAPFLDNDLVDFAMRVPARLKLGKLSEVVRLNENEPGNKTARYFSKTKDGKLLLRKAMERYIPSEITTQVKQGFSGPDASWFKGESMHYVHRRFFQRDAKIYEYLDRETIQRLITEHLEGKENRRLLIWSLLNVEQWCESFLPGAS